jgi:hypothetical protein
VLFAADPSSPESLARGTDPIALVTAGLGVTVVGVTATLAGLLVARVHGPLPCVQSRDVSSQRFLVLVVVAGIVGLGASLLFLNNAGWTTGGQVVESLSGKRRISVGDGVTSSGSFMSRVAQLPAMAGVAWLCLTMSGIRTRWSRSGPTILILIGVFIPVAASSRTDAIQIVVLVAVAGWLAGVFRPLAVVVAGALSLVVLAGLLSLRCESAVGQSCGVGDSLIQQLFGTEHWASVTKTGHIVQRTPEAVPYQLGATYVATLAAPVPKALWTDKPQVRAGPLVGEKVLQLGRDGRTGAPPGLFGELYLNFGWAGVVGGGVVFGRLLQRLMARMDAASATSDPYLLFSAAVLAVALCIRLPAGDFAGVLVPTLWWLLVGWILLRSRLVTRPGQVRSRPPARSWSTS